MYVTNNGSSNTVSVIDSSSNTVVKTISGFGDFPTGIAFNPTNNDMYVTNQQQSVFVIDSSSNAVIATIFPVRDTPTGIAFNPANNDMYVTNSASGYVSIIDSSTNTVIGTISISPSSGPYGIAFNPDMYVVNRALGTVSVISTSTVVQPPTHTTITSAVDGNGAAV